MDEKPEGIVWIKEECSRCAATKERLSDRRVEYRQIEVVLSGQDPLCVDALAQLAWQDYQLPVILLDGAFVEPEKLLPDVCFSEASVCRLASVSSDSRSVEPATERSDPMNDPVNAVAVGAPLMTADEMPRPRVRDHCLKAGITRTREFERKGLATHAVNVGIKCGHGCLWCSTGAVLRTHPAFRLLGENPFGRGYAIVDPSASERVARDARRIRNRGLIQLCTLTDAWAPEAKRHNTGRRCLEAILSQLGWIVRILTKSATIVDDFDFIEQYRNRVLVGLSLTATPENSAINKVLEPSASDIEERMLAMVEAAARGIRTYGMLCPLLPGVADSPEQIDQLVRLVADCRAEEIFVEPVNPRGPGLRQCQEALELWGYAREAEAVGRIRKRERWSQYVVDLVRNVQRSVRRHFEIGKLRFLLYPSALLPAHEEEIRKNDEGVIWL